MPSAIYLGACFYDSARVCIFYIRMVIRLHKCSDMVHLVKHVCLVFSWYLDLCAHLVDLTFEVQQRTMLDPMIIGIAAAFLARTPVPGLSIPRSKSGLQRENILK